MNNTDNMIKHLQELVAIKSISGPSQGEYPFGKGPYEVTLKDGKLFGRGVIDDKGPAIAVIHAMKELLENEIPLSKRVRIIFGTSEETGDEEDLRLYKEQEEQPDMGFTPDADFPVVYLEKGIAEIELSMDLADSGLVMAQGGNAVNMIPDTCELSYIKDGKECKVQAQGKSAHGSMPWLGENAIGYAIAQITYEKEESKISFARFYQDCIGMRTDGVGLGCDFADEQNGDTTVNPGVIEVRDNKVVLTLDIRCAVSCTSDALITSVRSVVESYGIHAELTEWCESVYMDKEGEFVQSLMNVYADVTGDDTEPLIMGGGTYARSMEHIVAFGPTFPGRECTEHQVNEYMYMEDLIKGKEIYYEVIRKICS